MNNQLDISEPSMQVPTGLGEDTYTASFKVRWVGPPSPTGDVVYKLVHQPAVSIPLSDGWYGTKVSGVCIAGRGGEEE